VSKPDTKSTTEQTTDATDEETAADEQTATSEVEETNESEEQVSEESEETDKEGGDELPEWAREKLTKANTEAASYRTKLREAEEKLKNVKTLAEVDELIESFKAEREKDEANAAKEKRELLVENIALTHKLPKKLWNRLVGDTREELEADAKELAADFARDDDQDVDLEGGLSPRDRDPDAGLGPRELAQKHGSRKRR